MGFNFNPFTGNFDEVDSSTMSDAEVKTAYENNADTNEFSDAEKIVVGNTSNTNTGDQTLEYMVPIWAEENGTLATNAHEWAYGNGANNELDDGIVIFVPSGWTCAVVAMSLKLGGTPTSLSVQLNLNGVSQGATCNVTATAVRTVTNSSFTPLAIVNNDYINFRTQTVSGTTAAPNVVTAWLRYVKT